MSSENSEITGWARAGNALESFVGTSPSRNGSTTLANTEDARRWLLRQPGPEAADAALCRSLTSTLGVTASLRTEGRFPTDGSPAYRVVTGCDFTVDDEANLPAASAKILAAMAPATLEQAEGWLVMLQAATAHRQDSDATSAVAYSLYAAELTKWPADVARSACERLARGKPGYTGTVWFPTLAELARECERLAAPRQAMLSALQSYTAPKALPYPSARGRPEPTDAEKAEVRRMWREAEAKLASTTKDNRTAARVEMPSTAGKPDEGGLTPEMRALIAKREAGAQQSPITRQENGTLFIPGSIATRGTTASRPDRPHSAGKER